MHRAAEAAQKQRLKAGAAARRKPRRALEAEAGLGSCPAAPHGGSWKLRSGRVRALVELRDQGSAAADGPTSLPPSLPPSRPRDPPSLHGSEWQQPEPFPPFLRDGQGRGAKKVRPGRAPGLKLSSQSQ